MNSVPALIAFLLALPSPIPADELKPELERKIRALLTEANEHYRKKDHQKSIERCKQALELVPPDDAYDSLRMKSHYFIAANYCLLEREAESLLHLEKAIDFGMTQMEYLEQNNDFAGLRRSKAYSTLAGKMRRKTAEKLKRFDFSVTSFDGKPLRKKDFLGQVLIVDIWGTWCGPCRMEIPHFIELHKKYADQGLRIVGLNSERTKDLKEAETTTRRFIETSKVPYPCALVTDEILKSIPGFNAFPTTIFIGRDGVPRAIEVGARDLTALEAIVRPLLAEPPPPADPGAKEQHAPPVAEKTGSPPVVPAGPSR